MKKSVLLFIVLSLLACDQKNKNRQHTDEFYSKKSDFDMIRIPLIKPYEAVNASEDSEWIVHLADTAGEPVSVPGTKHINVIDSVILIHGQKTLLDGQPINEAWFVFIPKNHVFQGFKSHQEYIHYTASISIKDPKMYDVKEVFNYFNNKDTLNWQRINQSY